MTIQVHAHDLYFETLVQNLWLILQPQNCLDAVMIRDPLETGRSQSFRETIA